MPDRFHLTGPWEQEVVLDGAEAHHLGRVLRAVPGMEVELFDGAGASALARVTTVGKREVALRLSTPVLREAAPVCAVTLAVAPPKGERLRWLVEKATELGVDRLIPLRTSRTVVEPGDGKLEKLRQVALEACKQCRRNRLPRIDEMISLDELLHSEMSGTAVKFFGRPLALPLTLELQEKWDRAAPLLAIVGPEGGFTSEETESLLASGVLPASIGNLVLRVETAAIAFSAIFCAARMSPNQENS